MAIVKGDLHELYSEKYLSKLFSQGLHGHCLFHIALQKSGSTWLSRIIRSLYEAKGWNTHRLVPSYGRRTQEIDPRCFFQKADAGQHTFYWHQHCAYSEYTEKLIIESHSQVFLQVRNIFDVCISGADHIYKMIHSRSKSPSLLPMGIDALTKDELIDYVIDFEIPWYVKFIEGWFNSTLVRDGTVCIVTYEELLDSPFVAVKRVLHEVGLSFSDSEVHSAIANVHKQDTLKNVAIVGRGRNQLSTDRIRKIERLFKYVTFADSHLLSKVLG